MTEHEFCSIIKQLTLTLVGMHEQKSAFRDIKPANALYWFGGVIPVA